MEKRNLRKEVKYSEIDFDGDRALLRDSEGNVVEIFYLEELVRNAMEDNEKNIGLGYTEVEGYVEKDADRIMEE